MGISTNLGHFKNTLKNTISIQCAKITIVKLKVGTAVIEITATTKI